MEQLRTKDQNRQLFALLSKLNWTHLREALAFQYSNGRTTSTSKLTQGECKALIMRLQEEVRNKIPESQKKMFRKFFSVCHQLSWTTEDGQLDYKRIDNWLKKYSYKKKGINDYRKEELPKLITQIQKLLPNEKS